MSSSKGKRLKLKGLAADVKQLPPLILLGIAEAIKYGHKFKAAKKLGQIALRCVKDDETKTKGLALLSLGHACWAVDHFTTAESHLKGAKALLENKSTGPLQSWYLMRSLMLLGDTLYNLDRFDEAEAVAREAEALIQKCRADPVEEPRLHRWAKKSRRWRTMCVLSMIELGELYYYTSCWDEGEKLLRELVPILVKHEGKRAHRTIEAQRDLASMLVNQDKYLEAELAYRQARAWHEQSPTFGREEQGAIDYNIAMCLSEQGKHAEAKEELKRLDVADDVFYYANGDWTLKLARTTHLRLGESEEVIALCRRFEGVLDARLGETHQVTMRNLADLVTALVTLGRFDEAVSVLRKMREREDSDPNSDVCQVLETHRNLAHTLRLAGQLQESEYRYRKCLEKVVAENWAVTHSGVQSCLEDLAFLYEGFRDSDNFTIACTKLQTTYLRLEATELNVCKYMYFRGRVFAMQGKPGPACALFRMALNIILHRKEILREGNSRKKGEPADVEKEPATVAEVEVQDEVEVHRGVEAQRAVEAQGEEGEGEETIEPAILTSEALAALEDEFKNLEVEKETSWPSDTPTPARGDRDECTGSAPIKGWGELSWWEESVRAAISTVQKGEVFQSPAREMRDLCGGAKGNTDGEASLNETVDAYLSRVATYPFAPMVDEWQQAEFLALPDTFDEYKRPAPEDWQRDLFGDV